MFIGYARISKNDGSQKLDLQIDALVEFGVDKEHIYTDCISGAKKDRPGLNACLKALRRNDTLVVWSLDRLGRNLKHLINCVRELEHRKISFKVLTGAGDIIDTTDSKGKFIFAIFAALAEYEREIIRERTIAGIKSARTRGRNGGRNFALNKTKVKMASAAMSKRETCVKDLCEELGVSRATLYKYVAPDGVLRDFGERVINAKN